MQFAYSVVSRAPESVFVLLFFVNYGREQDGALCLQLTYQGLLIVPSQPLASLAFSNQS